MKPKKDCCRPISAAVVFLCLLAGAAIRAEPTNELQAARSIGIEIPETTSADLALAFTENEVRANTTWRGKLIGVTSKVVKISEIDGKGALLYLEDNMIVMVRKDQFGLVSSLSHGDKIHVYGRCTGRIDNKTSATIVGLGLISIEPQP